MRIVKLTDPSLLRQPALIGWRAIGYVASLIEWFADKAGVTSTGVTAFSGIKQSGQGRGGMGGRSGIDAFLETHYASLGGLA